MACKSVLVVEDDEDIRFQFTAALKAEGYSVLEAANGARALEVLKKLNREELPGCIILDLMMPVMDGKVFLDTLKGELATQFGDIKVIVATAKGSPINPESIPHAVERVQKPMELDELYRVVKKHCGHPGE